MNTISFEKNASLVFTRLILGAVLGLVISSFLARTLGPVGNGVYSLVTLCPLLAVSIGGLGVGPAAVYLVSKRRFGIPEIIVMNIVVSLVTAGIITFIGFSIILSYAHKWFPNVPLHLLLISMLTTFPIMMFVNLVSVYQGMQVFKLHGIYTLLPQVTMAAMLVICLQFFNDKLTVSVMTWALGYVFALGALLYRFRDEIKTYNLSLKIASQYLSESMKFGVQAHVANLIAFLNYRIDVYLLAALAGTYAVGIYNVSVLLAEALWLVSNAASTVIFPTIATIRDDDMSKNITPFICRWVLLGTIVAALIVITARDLIIKLIFGSAFAESGQVLLWLMPGVILWSIARVICNDIAGRGRPEINLFISLGALAINIMANFVLIPKFGASGAAIASSISYSLLTIMIMLVYSRLLHVKLTKLLFPSREDLLIVKSVLGTIMRRANQT